MNLETMASMYAECKKFVKDFEKAEELAVEYLKNEISKGVDYSELKEDKHVDEIYDAIAADSAACIVQDIVMSFVSSCLNESAQEAVIADIRNEIRKMEEEE